DLDADGDLDLVVSQWGQGLILTNDGGGRFTPREPLEAFGGGPGLAIADIDGDGTAEILQALGTMSGSYTHLQFAHVAVFRRVAGAYRLDLNHVVGAAPSQLLVRDLEGDGDLDVITVHSWGDTPRYERRDISVIENLGRGRLASVTMRVFADWSTVPWRDYPTRLFALPRPGRRLPDLLMGTTRGAQRFDNLGDGRFADPVRVMDVEPVEVRDLTGDGVLDVIASSWTDTFWVHVGDASGGFTRTQESIGLPYRASVRTRPHALPDLLVWRYAPPGDEDQPVTATVLPNLGGGRFGAPRPLEGVTYSPRDRAFLGADVNGDGVDDVLVARWGERHAPDSLFVFESQRGRGYQLAAAMPLEFDPTTGTGLSHPGPRQILTRELDRGRGTEIVVWDWSFGGGGSRLRLVHRERDGNYRLLASMPSTGEEAKDIAFEDFDGDGRGDVLIGEEESLGEGPLIGFRGAESGGFERLPRWYVGIPISGLVSADFDGDRQPDLALVTGQAMSLHFFRNAHAKRMHRPTPGVVGRPGTAPLASTVLRSGSARVEFVMSRDGAASVAVYDVGGRRVVARDLGWRAAGP
ncbi:MAG TPA: VCBS repeat-containing protein, partial [Gemmatimonadaceae bacterium]|nr:VCBS repeat-containing protein [Gemmatimonadaceae bacterium]